MEVNGQSLDPTATQEITDNVNRQAHMSNADVANDYNQGISSGRGLLNQQAPINGSLAYGDKATSDAIRSRYMPQFNRAENELKLENMRNAQTDHLRNLQTATQAASEEVELNKQKALLKWKIEQANKKANGAIVGNVLGIIGGAVGAYFGGVGGAAAGYQAGQGVGNAVGGS